jgi:hypothetical protein
MTQQTWDEKWNKIKVRAHTIAEDIKSAMGPRDYPRSWGNILICLENMRLLERLVQGSDARIGLCGNPVATIERLIKSIVAIDEPGVESARGAGYIEQRSGRIDARSINGRDGAIPSSVKIGGTIQGETLWTVFEDEKLPGKHRCVNEDVASEFTINTEHNQEIQKEDEEGCEPIGRSEGHSLEDVDTCRPMVTLALVSLGGRPVR